jgi:hypothetical protein
MIRNVQWVNSTMDEIDDLNRELYEALIDGSHDEVESAIKKLNKVLLDVRKSIKDE